MRFREDAMQVVERGGIVIRIRRPMSNGGTNHAWEHGIDSIPASIVMDNVGTEEELKMKARAMFQNYFAP